MAVKYREDESINFNPNLPAGLIQVGSAGAGGEALSQGLETFKPQTTETATILPQTTFQPIAGVGQATSNIFENIQKRFGPTGASPRGDFETDIFRNVIDPDDEDEDAEDEQDLIDEFGLVTPDDIDPTITSPAGPDLKPGQFGYNTLKKLDDGLTNLFDVLGGQARTTSTGGGGRGAENVFEKNKSIITDAVNNVINESIKSGGSILEEPSFNPFDAPAPTPGISTSVSPGVTEDRSSIGQGFGTDSAEFTGGKSSTTPAAPAASGEGFEGDFDFAPDTPASDLPSGLGSSGGGGMGDPSQTGPSDLFGFYDDFPGAELGAKDGGKISFMNMKK